MVGKSDLLIGRVKQFVAEITGDEAMYNEGRQQSAGTLDDGIVVTPSANMVTAHTPLEDVAPLASRGSCALLKRAREIAQGAHLGQFDKTNRPYFEHCQRVAEKVSNDEEKIVAFLHDVVEKNPAWTIETLRREGFTAKIIQAVDALTKRSDEDEESFLRRSSANELSRTVKVADLKDNLIQAHLADLDPSKYVRGLAIVEGEKSY
ncbi:hypothetical protein [Agrobacterium rosae]